ncbi:MAG: NUDIX domain-containing protein [Clostridia bacterium]|nr:NUDIX domain-containing protein [Clostridia bacterium]
MSNLGKRELLEQEMSEQEFLAQYKAVDYPRPSLTVDVVVFTVADIPKNNYRKLPEKELRVLLIKRGGHPFKGQWALPGGFVHPSETVGDAARRELLEETGVDGGHIEQLYTFSTPKRDPRTWVVSAAHMSLIESGQLTLKAGSDASEVEWFSVTAEESSKFIRLLLSSGDTHLSATIGHEHSGGEPKVIENNGLAFDHAKIIACAVRRLRGKLEYTDLAFSLMPERFTLTELQQVYEAILQKPLYKAAFRRKVADLIDETDEYTQNAGHRPSQLFSKRED